jgi:hypothetical protein
LALQDITVAWIKDIFTGSNTGIYGPTGANIPIDGTTAQVLGGNYSPSQQAV